MLCFGPISRCKFIKIKWRHKSESELKILGILDYSRIFTRNHVSKPKLTNYFFGFTSIRPKEDDFFIRERKISQENLKFRVLVMFSRKNEFFTNLAILIGYRLFYWIATNDRENIRRWPRKDDFRSKMFKSSKMIKNLCQ